MMMIKYSFFKQCAFVAFVIGTLSFVLGACTKYPDPPPFFEKFDSTDIPMKRKVLMIVVDGMPGEQIKEIKPPFIMDMLQHSKYSWKALTDVETSDAATWESLMTGYAVTKHQIRDSSFEVNTSDQGELEDKVIPAYPTFLKRLNALRPDMHTFAASPWEKLNEKALANVKDLVNAADDKEVKDSTVSHLLKGNPNLVIANFNEVNIAGKEFGFSADQQGYKDAVLKVDGYVKDLVNVIQQRPDYAHEQWLVVLTSTHGGTGKSYGGNTKPEREVFTAYYNPHFESYNIPGYDLDMGVKLHSNTAEIPDDSKYNIGSTGEVTVMLRINTASYGSNNPAFLSKSTNSYGAGNHQWSMMFQGSGTTWRAYMVSTKGDQVYIPATKISLHEWHTLTFKVYNKSGKRMAAVYTDGQFNSEKDITGLSFTNNKTLKLGKVSGAGGGTSTETIHDLRIWETAIPDSIIDSMACKPDGSEILSPYKADLIGYWPCKDGTGDIFKDYSSSGNDFVLNNGSWDLIRSFQGCKVDDGSASRSDVNQITIFDIPVQIFYWLRVNVSSNWDWKGNKWLDRFEKEFYKKQNTN